MSQYLKTDVTPEQVLDIENIRDHFVRLEEAIGRCCPDGKRLDAAQLLLEQCFAMSTRAIVKRDYD